MQHSLLALLLAAAVILSAGPGPVLANTSCNPEFQKCTW